MPHLSTARLACRLRARRGAVSAIVLLPLLLGAALLPLASHEGALGSSQQLGVAHSVASPAIALNVTMNDTAPGFYWSTDVVSSNTTVDVLLHNNGSSTHSFSLYNVSGYVFPTSPYPSPAQVNKTWANQSSPGPNIWLPAGGWTNFSFVMTDPGVYEVLSLYPWQFQSGFYTFLHVLPAGSATKQYAFTNTTSDLTFTPNILVVQPNIPVVFEVTAQGAGHTFTLDGCSNDSAIVTGVSLPSSDPCLGASPTYSAAIVNLAINTLGQTYASAPVILKPGIYWFMCTVPGHFAAGMWGKVYVGIPQTPAGSTPSVTNVIQYAYLGLAATVIGGASFLVLMGMNEQAAPAMPSSGSKGDAEPSGH